MRTMIAVIFEVWPAPGRAGEYFQLAGQPRAELEKIDGFISAGSGEVHRSPA